jgi:hypothetical protein
MMSDTKHTPVPWTTDAACGFPRDVHDAEGMLIAHCSSELAASRIVAAINACAHIPTNRLEMAMPGQMKSSLDNLCNEVERLERQCDKLREALLLAFSHIDMSSLEISHCKDAEIIRKALVATGND